MSAYQRQLSSLQKQQTYYKTITNFKQYSTKFSTFQQNFKNQLGYHLQHHNQYRKRAGYVMQYIYHMWMHCICYSLILLLQLLYIWRSIWNGDIFSVSSIVLSEILTAGAVHVLRYMLYCLICYTASIPPVFKLKINYSWIRLYIV